MARIRAQRNRLKLLAWVWSHPANRQHRFTAVWRAISFQVKGRILQRPTEGRIGRRAKFLAEIGSYGSSKALYANPPDWPEMLVWKQRLRAEDLFVDIGANIGVYALWAADLGAHVVAVEPGPATAQRLRANVALNPHLAIEVVEAAVTDHEGTELFDPSGSTTARLGQGVDVVATTVDALLAGRRAAGVKIDVEGSERLVIEGAADSLAHHRIECLQVEWNTLSKTVLNETREPILAILRNHRYEIYRPDQEGNLTVDSGEMGSDIFALPLRERPS